MSPVTVVVDALLIVGVVVELVCCVGIVVMRTAYDKLHYTGPASIVGPLAFALAIVLREALSQAGIKALLVALLLIVASPVLTHATARAIYIRERDHVEDPHS